MWILCRSQKKKWNRLKTWWSLSDKEWNGRLKRIKKIFKNSKIKKGSKNQYEYYVDHKNRNEIKLKPHGHQVIKSENGRRKRIKRIF